MVKNEYFACPLCGMNKIVHSIKREKKERSRPEELRWPILDLKTYLVLQVREGGGKKAGSGAKGRGKAPGSGFHLVPSESLTLSEALKSGEYDSIIEGMKEQLIRLITDSVSVGLIKKTELREVLKGSKAQ